MQVAALRTEITHLGMALDPTPDMVAKALDAGADMVLSHHPLAMKPAMPDTLNNFHAVLRLLFGANVPLYSAHTSLDANLHGPAAWLADAFSLTGRQSLEFIADHDQGPPSYGFGIVGNLPSSLPYAAFAEKLAVFLGKTAWRASGPMPESISRIAYCPGSGESLAADAAAAGADIYITGDVKYHAALETPIRILDVGHFILEETMMRVFAQKLRAACAPLTVTFHEAADPFTFESAV